MNKVSETTKVEVKGVKVKSIVLEFGKSECPCENLNLGRSLEEWKNDGIADVILRWKVDYIGAVSDISQFVIIDIGTIGCEAKDYALAAAYLRYRAQCAENDKIKHLLGNVANIFECGVRFRDRGPFIKGTIGGVYIDWDIQVSMSPSSMNERIPSCIPPKFVDPKSR